MLPKKKDLVTFALIWALIFMVIGLAPAVKQGDIRIWSVVVSVLFAVIAILKPQVLTGFYKVWVRLGGFVGGVFSKVIMFVLYFGFFTPVSLFLKLLGKDLLNKKVDRSQKSYWIERKEQPQSMKNQF